MASTEASPEASPEVSPGQRNSSSMLSVPDNIQELRDQIFNLATDAAIIMPTNEFHARMPLASHEMVAGPTLAEETHSNQSERGESKAHSSFRTTRRVCLHDQGGSYRGETRILRTSKEGHNHDYEAVEDKLPSGVRRLVAQEVAKGYGASQVVKALKKSNGNLEAL
ncbi:uncharacterized protein N7496_003894 [Penicillium cataractarum]|uniref:Uncharacterized protein n=1 Tax=Penicillium cataractarum TaxID=2100454 RepID=A0A9W9SMX6_9EURO|nr:uncharacterized protein N7496_003894 [Penicillium cataractarum]KAJ5381466.1 hypothetical protein N7496_003894 [Penicillium cataractarum]